jgi:hypothetical protein
MLVRADFMAIEWSGWPGSCLIGPSPGQQRLLTCICDRHRLSRPAGLLPPSDQGSLDDQRAGYNRGELREVDYLTRVNQAAIFVGGVE